MVVEVASVSKNPKQELEALSLLAGEYPDALSGMKDAARLRHFRTRQVIVAQDEPDKEVFCVLKGTARAVVYSSEGHEIWLDDFGPGELFGEMAALTGLPRSADIVARTTVAVAVFSARDFVTLMERYGALSLAICRRLINRIQHTTQRMFELSALSAPGRIYAELLREAEDEGRDERHPSEARVIRPAPQITELARRVNATRETVSRTINDLERKGLLIRKSNAMIILAPKQLGTLTYIE